ncbi:mitochondrial enolase superfamily member 1 isoform X1 [Gadus macrocephalus]|uniref:mitochondrial enolase superfamily member 1 isoform X1 n=1 Tax=Gadus macrocephalus TaxID=80720 RepID=UPI0028CB4858|nr:mitochondrial enolase superfamily member 1 isoform X1 [Gadus macrocephalus]
MVGCGPLFSGVSHAVSGADWTFTENNMPQKIVKLTVKDVRFPTSLGQHGSDAMHTDPDYSVAYVVIETDGGMKGYGLTFTVGRGTEVVVCAVKALSGFVVGKTLEEIVGDFSGYYRLLTSDGQMRWIGPEKGVIQLATAAVLNAVWDLWARAEGKPLWKLLVDMSPEQLVSCIDFRYITDALTEQEALDLLRKAQTGKTEREEQMLKEGYPAYTTSCAWLGYSDQQLTQLCTDALASGWSRFKVKVGAELEDDERRCRLIRQMIGPDKTLMIDANQRWDVGEAISWVTSLAPFRPLWIEEPTSPDDILGHATISKALAPLGIGVASGEQCHNRVMFKQFLQASALQFVQIDSCRLGSVNENLAVLLMAHKFQVPVCPHAGGVGLCELVQHLILFDYISVSADLNNRMCEYVDHLHEHFTSPVVIRSAHYLPPKDPGYSCEMLESSVETHQFPGGEVWANLLAKAPE